MSTNSVGREKNGSVRDGLKKLNLIPNMVVLGVSELVATGLLMFLGCMGCIAAIDAMPLPHHVPAFVFGLVIMLIIQTFGHISGAHLNPQVTMASVILGHLKPALAPIYIFAQFVGGLLGVGLLKILVPPEYTQNEIFNPETNLTEYSPGLCTTFLHPKVSSTQGLVIEIILTAILVLVCAAVWDRRNAHNMDSVSLRFGLTITCIACVCGPFTGASMNTVRSFAPAVFNNSWESHWIYWVGPTIGCIIGSFFYKTVFNEPKEKVETPDVDTNMETVPLNDKRVEKMNSV